MSVIEPINSSNGLPTPWTAERFNVAKRMWADAKSAKEIETALGGVLTRSAIMGKLFRAGLLGKMSDRPASAKNKKPNRKNDRATTMRIKTLKVRGPSNGGAQIVESVVREADPDTTDFNAAIPPVQRLTLIELTDKTCHFPCGDVGEPDFFFCGATIPEHNVYCKFHARICYQPPMRPVVRTYYPTARSKPAVF